MLVSKTKMAEVRGRQVDVLMSPESNSPCVFCVKKVSKYTCPRCNVRYCSSTCYKSDKHLQCSELFYKDCVLQTLGEQKGSSEDKLKMLEMMKKLEEQDKDQDTFDTEDLEERLHDIDINSDPEAVWSALTENERKDFESAVKSGEIANVIDVWVPWWSRRDGSNNR